MRALSHRRQQRPFRHTGQVSSLSSTRSASMRRLLAPFSPFSTSSSSSSRGRLRDGGSLLLLLLPSAAATDDEPHGQSLCSSQDIDNAEASRASPAKVESAKTEEDEYSVWVHLA